MNRNDFEKEMNRLEEVFSSLSEQAIEEYYNSFKYFDLTEFSDAVSVLITDHKGEFTPKPMEILDIINQIRRKSSDSYPDEESPKFSCSECDGTGFKTWLDQGRLKATPCLKCAKGRGIINASETKKPLGYPGGWREAYERYKFKKNKPT